MDALLNELRKEKEFLFELLEIRIKKFEFHSRRYHSEKEYIKCAKTKKILNLLKFILNEHK